MWLLQYKKRASKFFWKLIFQERHIRILIWNGWKITKICESLEIHQFWVRKILKFWIPIPWVLNFYFDIFKSWFLMIFMALNNFYKNMQYMTQPKAKGLKDRAPESWNNFKIYLIIERFCFFRLISIGIT